MATAALFSAPSTHLVVSGAGAYYGLSISPAAGGTVVLADTVDIGHAPELSTPSSSGDVPGALLVLGPWPANPVPAYIEAEVLPFADGLSISYTSTISVSVFYDD
jgi:hypothetical protein